MGIERIIDAQERDRAHAEVGYVNFYSEAVRQSEERRKPRAIAEALAEAFSFSLPCRVLWASRSLRSSERRSPRCVSLAESAVSWLSRFGIEEPAGRKYVARMFPSLSEAVKEAPSLSFRLLASGHATRGGLNEQLLRYLEEEGVFETLSNGLDRVMQRVTAAPKE